MRETGAIPRTGWHEFSSAFNRDHETDMVVLEVMRSDIGAQVEGSFTPLRGHFRGTGTRRIEVSQDTGRPARL